MGKTMKVYRRPGKVQMGFVFLVCLLIMSVMTGIGIMLLMGGLDITWVEEELQGYFGK